MKRNAISAAAGFPLALLFGSIALGQERLPTGVTLLGADDTACRGVLMLESGVRGESDDVRRIGSGQFAVFEIESENVGWVCLGEATQSDTMECPSGTNYVRVSRNRDDDNVLFECYGRAR